MSAEPLFDDAVVWRAVGDDKSLADKALETFLESGSDSLGKLRVARDYPSFKSAAHRLKGTARAIGAKPLARSAELAELARDAPEGRQAQRALSSLEKQWTHTREAVIAFQEKLRES